MNSVYQILAGIGVLLAGLGILAWGISELLSSIPESSDFWKDKDIKKE
jgi:hypothetical protein